MPIYSALYSALGNLTYFLNNVGMVLGEAAKLENLGWNLSEVTFFTSSCKIGTRFGQTFCLSNRPGLIGYVRFWLYPRILEKCKK